ncbi:MAG: LysM peptidoglycan-binding domain-containing protein [Deltaproteobacteria bacterium]|nr:LysM peptidoglycan-binding domain-containing protein [Deltaproteobacteria bacterium]
MGSASGASAAYFVNLDKSGQRFDVQFNPKEFKINDKANWKASEEQQQTHPLLTYEKGDPSTVTMELIFDTTDTGADVYVTYVKPLRGFLSATVSEQDGQGQDMTRPPYIQFVWGSFTFNCVMESLAASAIMFSQAGNALRARVSVTLKQRQVEEFQTRANTKDLNLSSMGALFSGSSSAATTVVVEPGQTLSQIAPYNWREVAAANGIDDVGSPPVGQRLVIPLNSDLATVLTNKFMSYNPNKWAGGLAIEEYGTGYHGPSVTGGLASSSAFEDTPSDVGDAQMYSASDNPPPPPPRPARRRR